MLSDGACVTGNVSGFVRYVLNIRVDDDMENKFSTGFHRLSSHHNWLGSRLYYCAVSLLSDSRNRRPCEDCNLVGRRKTRFLPEKNIH